MSKELDKDIVAKLKEAFPKVLPDSSSLFFATEANPIKSYQGLRRVLDVTTAVGNRKCYLALVKHLAGDSEPADLSEGPYSYTIEASPKTFTIKDIDTLQKETFKYSLKDKENPLVEFAKFNTVAEPDWAYMSSELAGAFVNVTITYDPSEHRTALLAHNGSVQLTSGNFTFNVINGKDKEGNQTIDAGNTSKVPTVNGTYTVPVPVVTLSIIGNDTVVEGEEYSFDVRAEGGAANNTVVKVNGVVNNKYKVTATLPSIQIEATASNAEKVTKTVTVTPKPVPEETE